MSALKDEREAFEKWAVENGFTIWDARPDGDKMPRYPQVKAQAAWEAWQAALRHLEAAEKAAPVGELTGEGCWLIERREFDTKWLHGNPDHADGFGWSADVNRAVRFCRKQDAEGIIARLGLNDVKEITAREHIWLLAASRATERREGTLQECAERAEIERRAKEIYESWSDQHGYVPWVEGGNSTKQDEARKHARALIAAKGE